ncbi:hypothetical protein [Bartonella florencae]|uniref:hypothetical protein n=1 Tax=Bartonella florencae TaxID=928210 RepID=UPI00031DC2F4|nr:hypothetical protein [Bartonella florencae]
MALIIPAFFFTILTIVVLALLLNMIIVGPYYSLIKRCRIYAKLKEYKGLMKEQQKRLDDPQNSEIKKQILALYTEEHTALFKKWFAFSRKDYICVFFISLIIMAFKAHVYITFVREINGTFHHLGSPESFEVYDMLFWLLFLISLCACITAPVVLILRAVLTSLLKKKILKLEELIKQQKSN